MKTVLGSGGLGDAVLIYLQLDNMLLKRDDFFLTHVMLKEMLSTRVK